MNELDRENEGLVLLTLGVADRNLFDGESQDIALRATNPVTSPDSFKLCLE